MSTLESAFKLHNKKLEAQHADQQRRNAAKTQVQKRFDQLRIDLTGYFAKSVIQHEHEPASDQKKRYSFKSNHFRVDTENQCADSIELPEQFVPFISAIDTAQTECEQLVNDAHEIVDLQTRRYKTFQDRIFDFNMLVKRLELNFGCSEAVEGTVIRYEIPGCHHRDLGVPDGLSKERANMLIEALTFEAEQKSPLGPDGNTRIPWRVSKSERFKTDGHPITALISMPLFGNELDLPGLYIPSNVIQFKHNEETGKNEISKYVDHENMTSDDLNGLETVSDYFVSNNCPVDVFHKKIVKAQYEMVWGEPDEEKPTVNSENEPDFAFGHSFVSNRYNHADAIKLDNEKLEQLHRTGMLYCNNCLDDRRCDLARLDDIKLVVADAESDVVRTVYGNKITAHIAKRFVSRSGWGQQVFNEKTQRFEIKYDNELISDFVLAKHNNTNYTAVNIDPLFESRKTPSRFRRRRSITTAGYRSANAGNARNAASAMSGGAVIPSLLSPAVKFDIEIELPIDFLDSLEPTDTIYVCYDYMDGAFDLIERQALVECQFEILGDDCYKEPEVQTNVRIFDPKIIESRFSKLEEALERTRERKNKPKKTATVVGCSSESSSKPDSDIIQVPDFDKIDDSAYWFYRLWSLLVDSESMETPDMTNVPSIPNVSSIKYAKEFFDAHFKNETELNMYRFALFPSDTE